MPSSEPSRKVVAAIARQEGVSPVEVSPTLYDVIDPDALNALFAREATDGSKPIEVAFEYGGYDVYVVGDGSDSVAVTVQPVEADSVERSTPSTLREASTLQEGATLQED